MRAAHILGYYPNLAHAAIQKIEGRLKEISLNPGYTLDQMLSTSPDVKHGIIDVIDGNTGTNLLIPILGPSQYLKSSLYESCFFTKGTDPHVDTDIDEDFTLGLVLRGNHSLYTGNHRFVGALNPGTLFLLHNKKTHGASPNLGAKEKFLVFLSVDFHDELSIDGVLKRIRSNLNDQNNKS